MQAIYQEIKTQRLLLRRVTHSDQDMVSYLRTDKEINKYIHRSPEKANEKATSFIERINQYIDNDVSYYWGICLSSNAQMIGSICLWNLSTDRKYAEVGYDLSPEFQGNGYMSESLQSVLNFGFTKLTLDIVEAYTHRENERSKNMLLKNNFKLVEGKTDNNNPYNLVFEIKKF